VRGLRSDGLVHCRSAASGSRAWGCGHLVSAASVASQQQQDYGGRSRSAASGAAGNWLSPVLQQQDHCGPSRPAASGAASDCSLWSTDSGPGASSSSGRTRVACWSLRVSASTGSCSSATAHRKSRSAAESRGACWESSIRRRPGSLGGSSRHYSFHKLHKNFKENRQAVVPLTVNDSMMHRLPLLSQESRYTTEVNLRWRHETTFERTVVGFKTD
jgi:hypothetical protein